MPVLTTACPRNCYSTCSLAAEIDAGRIRRIGPHPDNRATPGGPCLKGLAEFERVVSPDRLLYPLYRRPGSGAFERVGWDEALDRIAEKLRQCRAGPGPQSVLYYTGSGTKGLLNAAGGEFWRLFGGATTTYGDLCWPAGLEATRLTLGANEHNAPWDLANARLIVLWGKNAAETNVHQMPFVEDALDRGATVVVVDPRRTETALRAHLHLQPRPGTDGAIALAVAHCLVRDGRVDASFIAAHVLGFEAFAARVREWTPARAAATAGIPAARIEELAALFGRLRPATLVPGFGMQRYTNSGQTMRALIALVALTGNLGKPGAGWMYANLQSHIFDSIQDPLAFYPPAEPDGVMRCRVSVARLGEDMLALREPPLRMIWVERGNPVSQNPDTASVRRAFAALEFRVVVDMFLTDTAREADIVLPAKSFVEQTDVIGAYWHPYVQVRQKLLPPPGEVKPETEIYWHLAARLGIPAVALEGRIPAPSDAAVEAHLEQRLQRFPGLTLARLREGPVLSPAFREVAFAGGRFPTPSGRIEIYSEAAAARWGVDPLPDYVEPQESPRRAAVAAPFPLHLLTPNTKNRIHSQFRELAMLRPHSSRPLAEMHPLDAAARGIADGDEIEIFNERGRFHAAAFLQHGIRPGCVAVTNGWSSADGGSVNLCSRGRETDLGHGAAFHDVLVEVVRGGRSS